MNKLIIISLLTFISLFTVKADDNQPEIRVNANAEIKVDPDYAIIRMNIETNNKDVVVAKAQNAEILQKVTASLSSLNINKEQFKTTHFSVHPRYNNSITSKISFSKDKKREFLGYFVSNNIELKIKDIKKTEQALSVLLAADVARINGIQFKSSKQEDFETQARKKALIKARKKAKAMCDVLDQKLGAPIQINEGHTGGIYPRAEAIAFSPRSKTPQNTPSLAMGKITISSNVTVTFTFSEK